MKLQLFTATSEIGINFEFTTTIYIGTFVWTVKQLWYYIHNISGTSPTLVCQKGSFVGQI